MNLCLEFTMSAADLRELTAMSAKNWHSLGNYLSAMVMGSLGAFCWLATGFDWLVAVELALAVSFCFSDRIFISLFVLSIHFVSRAWLVSRVSIDEETISIEQAKHQRTIPWSSFTMTGTVREIENHFMLESGRGAVWIPKRAFATADDLVAFRALVKEKMGERCQFNQ